MRLSSDNKLLLPFRAPKTGIIILVDHSCGHFAVIFHPGTFLQKWLSLIQGLSCKTATFPLLFNLASFFKIFTPFSLLHSSKISAKAPSPLPLIKASRLGFLHNLVSNSSWFFLFPSFLHALTFLHFCCRVRWLWVDWSFTWLNLLLGKLSFPPLDCMELFSSIFLLGRLYMYVSLESFVWKMLMNGAKVGFRVCISLGIRKIFKPL